MSASRASPRLILGVLALAAFMASLDLFIVNVAFDAIERDFGGASLASASWVLNGYAIVYAALLVPLGRLADLHGPKRSFLLGLLTFTAASAACAAATGLVSLVVARLMQAAGAALLTPTSMALLLHATPPDRRSRAVRIWAATGSLAAAAGPALGGLLVLASWRWVFLVNVPIGVVALVAAARAVPEAERARKERAPDLIGALVFIAAVSALALALVKADTWGWDDRRVLGSIATAGGGFVVFVFRSRRHPSPVIEPALFRIPAFLWANVATFTFSIGFAANLLANILWMQQAWHYTALGTGLAIAPGPLMVPFFAWIAQRAARKVRSGVVSAIGSALCGLGATWVLSQMSADAAYVTTILPGWMIAGAGVGLAMPTMLSTATVDLPPARSATGSAVVNMARQIGSVIGVSTLVALVGRPESAEETMRAFQRGGWCVAIASAAAALAALRQTPKARREDVAASASIIAEP